MLAAVIGGPEIANSLCAAHRCPLAAITARIARDRALGSVGLAENSLGEIRLVSGAVIGPVATPQVAGRTIGLAVAV